MCVIHKCTHIMTSTSTHFVYFKPCFPSPTWPEWVSYSEVSKYRWAVRTSASARKPVYHLRIFDSQVRGYYELWCMLIDDIYKCIWMGYFYINENSTQVCSLGYKWQYVIGGLSKDLAPNMRQTYITLPMIYSKYCEKTMLIHELISMAN